MSPLIKSIRIKTLLSVLVPFVIVLILVAGIGNLMFESNAQEAVKQRDTELAMISAARLSEGLNQYSQILQRIAITDEIRSMDPARAQEALKRANANGQFLVFDGGVILYDGGGIALTAIPVSAARGGEGFTDPVVFTKVNETLRASFSNVFRDEKSGNDVILIGVPVLDSSGELAGVLAGLCTVKYSLIGSMFVNVLELKAGGSGYAYLVDGNGHLIYHRYKPEQGNELAATEPVLRVTGRETGAVVTRDTPGGKTVISAFAPVPGTQWGVVTHEEWETVFGPLRYFSNSILLLIIAGGAISAILIFFQITRILGPIQNLTRGAQRIGDGDFTPMVVPESGDEIQTLALQFNTMAGELKNSFAELEQRMDELRKMKDEIQDTKHYLESIIKVATVGIIVVDTEGRFEFGNTAFFEIVGWPVTDLLGEPFMNVVHPDHREYMCRIWDAGQKEGATPSKGSLFEIDIAKKNGERRSLLISYTDMMIGSERKYCIVFKDITEKKQAEKALVRTNDELNAANEELTVTEEEVRHNFDELQRSQQALAQARKKLNLLNTITFQDIQNALFSLEGYLELQRELPMDEKAGAYLNKEKVVAEKISNTLAFAKNYQNMGINPPLWQNTNQVFLLAISHLDISGFIRNIILDNLEMYADPLLETVFFNLAENVTRHGKTATEISLYYRETNDSLTVFIEDNGGGIPDTDKEKIFERGYGGQKGMGLFLVREILGITDISIKETGMYGQGARFEIIVPKGAYRFTDRKERMDQ